MLFKEFDKSLNCIKRKVSSSVGAETQNQYCVKTFEYFRLACADDVVWNSSLASVRHQEVDIISRHCRVEICADNLGCARTCLEHLLQVADRETER